jgi:hypothetical protein
MVDQTRNLSCDIRRGICLIAAVVIMPLVLSDFAFGQGNPSKGNPSQGNPPAASPQQSVSSSNQPSSNQSASPEASKPPPGDPGLVEEMGKLLKESADGLSATFSNSKKAIEDLNARAKDATSNLPRLGLGQTSIVSGRVMCPVAVNGAPDCKLASNQLCLAKGYKEGNSLDIESAEKCPAKVYLSGRQGVPGECRTENFVTRAVCQ